MSRAAGDTFTVREEQVLRCQDLRAAMRLFLDQLGYRVETISPADDPTSAVLSRGEDVVVITTLTEGLPELGGPLVIPDGAPTFTHTPAGDRFGDGRAGMQYRDLVPGRQNGRFIASHIRIPDGGPVPDYVHYHDIRFQMIFVHAGWVRLVYEDQGEPFVMHAGDCVVQPPLIRHRVLESSAGLEVVEIGCPARHDTHAEHNIELPTAVVDPHRDFGGQRFVRHIAAHSPWDAAGDGRAQDTGIGAATGGLAGVRVVRLGDANAWSVPAAKEFRFWFVRSGSAELRVQERHVHLAPADAVTFPAQPSKLVSSSSDFEVLAVTLPG